MTRIYKKTFDFKCETTILYVDDDDLLFGIKLQHAQQANLGKKEKN